MRKQSKNPLPKREKIAKIKTRYVAVVFDIPHLGGKCSTEARVFKLREGVIYKPELLEIYEKEKDGEVVLTELYSIGKRLL